MSEPVKKKLTLSDLYKKRSAERKAAKAARAVRAQAEVDGEVEEPSQSTAPKSSAAKSKKTKRRAAVSTSTEPRKRIRADELPWKKVNTSSLPGMDGGGGMMMLEELDGVAVEWVDDGAGRKTAKFVASDRPQPVVEEVDQDDEEDEDEGMEEDLPTFAGMDASDLDEEDDEVETEPTFDDSLLPEWKGVPIHATLKQGMVALQFSKPTDIQSRAVPPALDGRDIVGVAETGSGKTLAYSLPILSYLLRSPPPRAGVRRPLSALVLCPTRELAIQVNDHLTKVLEAAFSSDEDDEKPKKGKIPRISVGTVVGGLSSHKQKRIIDRGCDVLVATPGRLWDLLKTDDVLAASVRALRFLVIDEADRMIETGHFAELENIVGLTQRNLAEATVDDEDPVFAAASTQLTETPARDDMQTFVFSATLSKDLQVNLKRRKRSAGKRKSSTLEDLVDRLDFRDESPTVIDLSPEGGLVASLRESMVECIASDKDLYLYYFLLRYPGRSLVFTGSIDGIRRLIPLFETLNMPVWPLHSQLQQKQRLKNLDRFKAATNGVMIATDVAARGLDIPHVDHVIHFNLPRTADAYVHRSGRTARAQNPGFALQLVAPEDRAVQRGLLKSLGRDVPPPDLEIEAGFLPKLKERIALAKEIEKAQHYVKKDNHDRNWLKEAAEAMDLDIDPDMLSDTEHDPDAPFSRKKAVKKSRNVAALKAQLADLLQQRLLARGVSARYPTSGSRVIVHDVVSGSAHSNMLGAATASAYETVGEKKGKKRIVTKARR